jgi:hypothetical protein
MLAIITHRNSLDQEERKQELVYLCNIFLSIDPIITEHTYI